MKVYVVSRYSDAIDGEEVVGVYSTEALAKRAMEDTLDRVEAFEMDKVEQC